MKKILNGIDHYVIKATHPDDVVIWVTFHLSPTVVFPGKDPAWVRGDVITPTYHLW
jgi:hypothetical protein